MKTCLRAAKTLAIVFCGVLLVDLADADTAAVADVFGPHSLLENLAITALVSLFFIVPWFLRAILRFGTRS